MVFKEDIREQSIVTALLSGQRSIIVDGVEVFLKPLKRNVFKKKEIEAKSIAKGLIKII